MPFKIFRKNCCGLDVHKTWIYACIGIADPNGRTEYHESRFSSFSNGLTAIPAKKSVWNPQANTGYPFLTF